MRFMLKLACLPILAIVGLLLVAPILAAVGHGIDQSVTWVEGHRLTLLTIGGVIIGGLLLLRVRPFFFGRQAGLERAHARMRREQKEAEVAEWRRGRSHPYHAGRDAGGLRGRIGRLLLHVDPPLHVNGERVPWNRQPPEEEEEEPVDVVWHEDEDSEDAEEPQRPPEPAQRPAAARQTQYTQDEAKAVFSGVFRDRSKKKAGKTGGKKSADLPVYNLDEGLGHGASCNCEDCKAVRAAWKQVRSAETREGIRNGHKPT